MSEWHPMNTSPKDGSTICALVEIRKDIAPITIYWHDECGWCSIWSGYDIDEITNMLGWVPLPEQLKKHHCKSESQYVRCEYYKGKLRLLGMQINGSIEVNFCPICGTKA